MFSQRGFRTPLRERQANRSAWKSLVTINIREMWKSVEIVGSKWYINL